MASAELAVEKRSAATTTTTTTTHQQKATNDKQRSERRAACAVLRSHRWPVLRLRSKPVEKERRGAGKECAGRRLRVGVVNVTAAGARGMVRVVRSSAGRGR